MNIAVAMLVAALSNFARKVWGQDVVDKAVETAIIYLAEKYVAWTHTAADDDWLEFVKAKLKKKESENA